MKIQMNDGRVADTDKAAEEWQEERDNDGSNNYIGRNSKIDKNLIRAGAVIGSVVMFSWGAVGLYHRWQQNPGQAALAGLVTIGIIALVVFFGKRRKS